MHGLETSTSALPVTETVERMVKRIEQQGWHLFARIDHAAHAHKKDMVLRPTELILFGNPAIGTRLMQQRQLTAIDLPMKVLVWEDEQGQVRIAHNSLGWLKQRHGLTDEATLEAIEKVLTQVCAGYGKATSQDD